MNKDNAKYYLPLVQALEKGQTIQHRCIEGWRDVDNVQFNSPPSHYRIKPEPRVLYVLLRYDGTRWGSTFIKREAELWAEFDTGHDGIIRKFVEVIED